MQVTTLTWVIGSGGLLLGTLLLAFQLFAVLSPRAEATVRNVYGGDLSGTDPKAYFAVNQGWAWADTFFWCPLQLIGCIGMLLGQQWGFLLALAAAAPFVYSAIQIFIWDRDLGFRKNTATYWVTWAMFPLLGLIQGVYCFLRLLE